MVRRVVVIWKYGFVENDVTGNDNASSGEVVAPVPFVFQWVTKENTRRGARGEFVVHGGIEVRET